MHRLLSILLSGVLTLTASSSFAFETAEPAEVTVEADVSALPPVPPPPAEGNPYRGNATAAALGRSIFNQTCARCHGIDAVSKNLPGPDLTRLDRACRRIADPTIKALCLADNDAFFLDSARNGKVRVGVTHMPSWKNVLSDQHLWAIRTFLESHAP